MFMFAKFCNGPVGMSRTTVLSLHGDLSCVAGTLFLFALLLNLSACVSSTLSGAGITQTDISIPKYEHAPPPVSKISEMKDGIFLDDGEILIKTRGKSFLSVLDEVARLRRFNYTVLMDISKFYVDYFDLDDGLALNLKTHMGVANKKFWQTEVKQQKFSSIDEFVSASVLAIKEAYIDSNDAELRALARNLRYKWTGDGFVFFSQNDVNVSIEKKVSNRRKEAKKDSAGTVVSGLGELKDNLEGYKKIFLFNLSEREVSFYISRLLDIPYASFSPIRGADLPRRESSPIQSVNVGGGGAPNADVPEKIITATDWQLNAQTTVQNPEVSSNPVNNDGSEQARVEAQKRKEVADKKNDLMQIRWVSIPQQNALIIKAKNIYLEKISELLHAIDSDYKQIIIEAKVFQYSASTAKKMGLALGEIPGKLDITNTIGNAVFSISKTFGPEVANALPVNFYWLPAAERRFALLSALSLYAADSVVRVTADPRILLKPGQISTLDITTTKLVQPASSTSSSNQYSQVTTPVQVVAGVFFTVRPTLLSDNKIQLDLFLRQSEFSPSNEKNVLMAVSQNQLNTSIIANHGELISLGGMESKKYSLGKTGVPQLKDSSLVGGVFGVTDEDANTTHVEFMIRPSVHQIDDQLIVPIENVNALNRRVNKLIDERWDAGKKNQSTPRNDGGVR
ncbi:MAG: hypothetical protein K2P84_14330 [Undibacterium sp.]|nr:hypothetical protein [Undibacterium sp.]